MLRALWQEPVRDTLPDTLSGNAAGNAAGYAAGHAVSGMPRRMLPGVAAPAARAPTCRYDHVMPDDRTVLDHLLKGREALRREVERLTAAIAELDTVIGQIGGASRRVLSANGLDLPSGEPVNPPAEVEPQRAESAAATASRSGRAPAKRAAARRAPASGGRSSTGSAAEPPKSIRVHVLDMLAAEDREFGLAEIIDRIHAAGIQAHDDAVRSITIKLMKDGRVERVGRGQYRLARRGGGGRATQATPSAPPEQSAPAAPEPSAPSAPSAPQPEPEPENYTPPLNLGQPWDTGA